MHMVKVCVFWTMFLFGFYGKADLQLRESGGANYIGFKAPAAITTDFLWTLPATDGANGQCLGTDGAGALKWVTIVAGSGDMKSDGTVPMTASLRLSSGTVGAPSIAPAGDLNTGFYYVANGTTGLTIGGTERQRLGSTFLGAGTGSGGGAMAGMYSAPNVATYAIGSDAATGLYRASADTLAVTTANAERMRITSTGLWGIKTTSPQGTVDVNGEIKIKKNSSAPVVCSGTYDGRIALSSAFTSCVCNGVSWVRTNDGSTACTW